MLEGEEVVGEEVVVDEEEAASGPDLYYVPEKALDGIKEKLENGRDEDDIKAFLDKVTNPVEVDDEEMMLPVDMRGVGQDFGSMEDMLSELGIVGAAEAFVKARDFFVANKEEEPEDERAAPMTAGQWKEVLAEGAGEEEVAWQEGEEEELAAEVAE